MWIIYLVAAFLGGFLVSTLLATARLNELEEELEQIHSELVALRRRAENSNV